MGKFKKHSYLLLALALIGLMFILQQSFFSSSNVVSYISQIEENLKKVSEEADTDIFYISRQIKESGSIDFGKLLEGSNYPIFVFKNKELVYWSDHTYYFTYYDLRGYYNERPIKTKRGMFIAKKSMIQIEDQEFEIVALISIEKSYQIDNEFLTPTLNEDIFPSQTVRISTVKGNTVDIYRFNIYLFSVSFPEGFSYHSDRRWIMVVLMAVVVILLLLQLRTYLQILLNRGWTLRATLLLAFGLVSIRAIMLYYQIPYDYLDYKLFDSKTFASSQINPSLGDLFINLLCGLTLVLFFYANYPKIIRYKKILNLPKVAQAAISIVAVVLSYFITFWMYDILKTIYDNSLISLDITQGIVFPVIKIVCLLIFASLAIGYFFSSHILSKLLIKLSRTIYDLPLRFVVGSVIFYLISFLLEIENITLFNINAIYILFVSFLDLPISLKRSDYSTYIYLFVCAVVVSCIGAYCIFRFEENRTIQSKYKYANTLLIENDLLAEYHLHKLMQRVPKDVVIQNKFIDGSEASMDWVERKLRRIYFDRYFDKYDIEILLFDSEGKPYSSSRRYYNIELTSSNRQRYKTEYENIYFINDLARETKKYRVFIPIIKDGLTLGNILLQLNLKKVIPNSIHPSFFVDKRYQTSAASQEFSYGIYANQTLLLSSGDFTYDRDLLAQFEANISFLQDEIRTEDYHHLRVTNNSNQQIIISSPNYPNNQILTNFAFLFLLLVFVLLLIISGYNVYQKQSRRLSQAKKLNFNTKIQLYLNFAFFVPLIVVSIIVVSILNSSNIQETKTYYLEKTENISNNLIDQVQLYYNGVIDKDELQSTISELANVTQSDVNLFGKDGKLIAPSQDYIYENQLMNSVVNPKAFAQIIEQKQSRAMFEESIGRLNYNSAYVSVKSVENGEVLGIVGVPFFGSKQRYEKQVVDVLSKIMQAFAFILIGLLGISYFSARTLTAPLRLIRQKIRKVSFQDNNEPLDYLSDDEIGLLVNEYNKMLVKLEESKEQLSKKEKESAWREMAKQVAHEIKNPLTPMKLKIQQLERLLDSDEERTKRTISTLLDQIDTLSEIATSFSSFAEMPAPKEELFDIASILRKAVLLHGTSDSVNVSAEISEEPVQVIGDKQLLGRVFNNLIINSIQSIPVDREGRVRVRLTTSDRKVLISILDNGLGISEDIQAKVFVPNFTTKTSGSGIGLAISKRAIEHLGGRIWFESEEGSGTEFCVEMPLATSIPS